MSSDQVDPENFKNQLLALRKEIGIKIRHRRLHIDMETKVLAFNVGLSQGSISNIEKGKQAVTAERLWQFCIALKCSPEELLPVVPDELKNFDQNFEKMETEKMRDFAKAIVKNASI